MAELPDWLRNLGTLPDRWMTLPVMDAQQLLSAVTLATYLKRTLVPVFCLSELSNYPTCK